MRRRLLVRHFLGQFVENEFSPDVDRHQILALTAAALVTVPLFVTVFMGWKYLMRPLQAPGWTAITAAGDQITFCATSMLVSAIVATLEWDALALSSRDSMILGVMPVPHRELVRAKMTALAAFVGAFVIALNALPMVLHPAFMVANLPLNPLLLVPLIAAHGVSTTMAGAFGFAMIVAIREFLHLCLGPRRFASVAGIARSALLFVLLVWIAIVPIRFVGRPDLLLQPDTGPALLRPVAWFAATHAAIAGRVLDQLPPPDMPVWRAGEEDRFRTEYRQGLPRITALALRGTGGLVFLLAVASAMYLWNARRLHSLPEHGTVTGLRSFGVSDVLATILARRPARRAGLLFLFRTMLGSPVHRLYLVTSMAVAVALLLAMAPAPLSARADLGTGELAVQTLVLIALIAGFRAALRTAADARAGWLFGVADEGHLAEFRKGVRLGVMTIVIATVLLLLPLHAAAWGGTIAAKHALNGIAAGWLFVEVACARVEQPLVSTIPPNDGLNTVGVVFLGSMVLAVFMLAHVEAGALTGTIGAACFALTLLIAAGLARFYARDTILPATLPLPSHKGIENKA